MSDNLSIEIEKLLETSIDDLYVKIGQELYGKPAFPASPKHYISLANTWLISKRTEITKVICTNDEIKRLSDENPTTQSRITLVSAVADLIASIIFGVSPVTVSVLLVKEGISTICSDLWKSSHEQN